MKKAFTLSETLTVLMIIGVIALMAVPTLLANVNEQKNLAMLKKLYASYSINIQQVLTDMSRDGGYNCSSFSCTRAFNRRIGAQRVDVTGANIPEHKHNGILADTTIFNVLNENMNLVRTGEKMPDPNIKVDTTGQKPSVYQLANGASAIIYDYTGNCNTPIGTSAAGDFLACGILILDTNGSKGGGSPCKDRYAFYIANEQTPLNADPAFPNRDKLKPSYLVPFGYNVTNDDFSGHNGFDCTGKIVMNNWKIVK